MHVKCALSCAALVCTNIRVSCTWVYIVLHAVCGKTRAGAENLTCWIHDVDFLSCSWAVGPAAPADVQYDLYLNVANRRQQYECLHYKTDAQGTRIGCRFDDISRLSSGSQSCHILVRGRSAAFGIPCTDKFVVFSQIGDSYSIAHWYGKMRSGILRLFYLYFHEPHTCPILLFFSTQVRDRTPCRTPPALGEWCDQEEGANTRAWQTSLLIALGTLLALVCVFLICRRYLLIQRLYPPHPSHDKTRSADSFQIRQSVCCAKAGLEECLVTEVQVVQKT
uniref:Type I cytokine receptor cytokine-binding domain-containing protein n=1 Tax=Pan troglodytes TaxID=9598 RepID=A0A2I3SMI6_PANTR